MHHFVEDLIAHACGRTVVGVAGGIADQDVDRAPDLFGFLNHRLQLVLDRNAGADGHGRAAFCLNFFDHRFACVQFTARHHHFGASSRQLKSDGSANATTGASDDGNFAREIEQFHRSP